MAEIQRTPEQRRRDLAVEADYYLQGWTYREIAEEITRRFGYSITAGTVSNDMRQMEDVWYEEMVQSIDRKKSLMLAKLDRTYKEAWKAWGLSLEKHKMTIERTRKTGVTVDNPDGSPKSSVTKETQEETSIGEPRYLTAIVMIIDKQCKILGLDAPKAVEINWRELARKEGVDPDLITESLVNEFVRHMQEEKTPQDDATPSPGEIDEFVEIEENDPPALES